MREGVYSQGTTVLCVMPKSPDLASYCRQTTVMNRQTKPIALPLTHEHGVIKFLLHVVLPVACSYAWTLSTQIVDHSRLLNGYQKVLNHGYRTPCSKVLLSYITHTPNFTRLSCFCARNIKKLRATADGATRLHYCLYSWTCIDRFVHVHMHIHVQEQQQKLQQMQESVAALKSQMDVSETIYTPLHLLCTCNTFYIKYII